MNLIALPLIGIHLLSSLTFGSAPASISEVPTNLSDTSSSTRCEEDMPCWDCDTMGNKICGDPNLSDAWESFDASPIELHFDDAHILSYKEMLTSIPTNLKSGQVLIGSISKPNTWYLFEYVAQ